jgi:hypothetical protein
MNSLLRPIPQLAQKLLLAMLYKRKGGRGEENNDSLQFAFIGSDIWHSLRRPLPQSAQKQLPTTTRGKKSGAERNEKWEEGKGVTNLQMPF